MPRIRADRQSVEIPCTRCGNKFVKMLFGSSNISSLRFPQYKIQRYNDFDSPPREVNLCEMCADKLDRFLYIYTNGEDYYKPEEELEFLFKTEEENNNE